MCPAGFVAYDLEILYDLDIEAKGVADEPASRLARTEMPNADPAFVFDARRRRPGRAQRSEHLNGWA